MRKIFFLISISFVLLSSCGNKGTDAKSKMKPPVKVDVMIAQIKEFPKFIEVNGNVLANEMIELRPEVSGKIIYMNISDGASVESGTVLARINDAELQAQLQQQKVELELAQKNEQRMKSVLGVSGINEADYEAAVNKVASIEASIKIIEAQIEKTIIRAPFSGKLGLRMVSPGAYITPQTLITSLQQTDKIKIDFAVPETYESIVGKGSKIMVTSTNGTQLPATVVAVEPQINTSSRNIKMRAVLNDGILRPGQFVKISVDLAGKGIIVPTSVIIPDAISNQVVLVKNGKAKFTNVKTGERTPDFVEITEGVQPGDTVIVTGILFVRPGGQVQIRETKTIETK